MVMTESTEKSPARAKIAPVRILSIVADTIAVATAVAYFRGHGILTALLGGSALIVGAVPLVVGWPARRIYAAIAVLAVAFGGAASGSAFERWRHSDTATINPATVTLRFDPQLETVPFCHTYTGTGRIPDGYDIVVFDKATMDPASDFWFDARAERTGDGWAIKNVGLGDQPTKEKPGVNAQLQVDLFAQLVTADTAGVFTPRSNISVEPADAGVWKLRKLPGREVDKLHLVMSADRGACTPD
jgi:hypothetical protein